MSNEFKIKKGLIVDGDITAANTVNASQVLVNGVPVAISGQGGGGSSLSNVADETTGSATGVRLGYVSGTFEVIASGDYAVAEGAGTQATGSQSHAEGIGSKATGAYSHAEGNYTSAGGPGSHSEGIGTIALGDFSHAEGQNTRTTSGSDAKATHVEGCAVIAGGIIVEGNGSTQGHGGHAEGYSKDALSTGRIIVSNRGAHAEGYAKVNQGIRSSGKGSHAEGTGTTASGDYSHAEGYKTTAIGNFSHAEGRDTTSIGGYGSHAEGYVSVASAYGSHSEGGATTASATYSHAEGKHSTAMGDSSHAEGDYTVASGTHGSHAEGYRSVASLKSQHAHAGGMFTVSSDSQYSRFVMRGDTTTVTSEDLVLPERFTIDDETTIAFTVTCVARQDTGAGNAMFKKTILLMRDAGTVTATTEVNLLGTDQLEGGATGGSDWTCVLGADDTNKSLKVTITGEGSKNIRWVATVEATQVKY